MPIRYEAVEAYVLNETQEGQFVSFVTGIWPGTAANIISATLRNETVDGSPVRTFSVRGLLVAATPAELPTPPFELRAVNGDYKYKHVETVELTPAQVSAFATFLSSTWTGVVTDVSRVTFTRTTEDDGSPGTDILARIFGTKVAATPAELPAPPVRITEIT